MCIRDRVSTQSTWEIQINKMKLDFTRIQPLPSSKEMQQKHFALILKLNQRPDHHNYLSQIRMVNGRCRSKSSRSKMKILNTYIPTTPDSNSKYQSEKRKKVIHTKRREEQMPPISKNISEICAGHIKFNKYFKEVNTIFKHRRKLSPLAKSFQKPPPIPVSKTPISNHERIILPPIQLGSYREKGIFDTPKYLNYRTGQKKKEERNTIRFSQLHILQKEIQKFMINLNDSIPVSYTHLRAHETSLHLVCRLLLEKKKKKNKQSKRRKEKEKEEKNGNR
eukprot:TRINITY_DN1323_c0_g1_i1.p1 TRINITY_DN1323_c0_g1~~TRINITY_DN1323_c0_g1_i1.p1  ORF type:complete len:279 (-),score=53.71 TRINITY_DN1323_c0_g1_i1:33-869(-)